MRRRGGSRGLREAERPPGSARRPAAGPPQGGGRGGVASPTADPIGSGRRGGAGNGVAGPTADPMAGRGRGRAVTVAVSAERRDRAGHQSELRAGTEGGRKRRSGLGAGESGNATNCEWGRRGESGALGQEPIGGGEGRR